MKPIATVDGAVLHTVRPIKDAGHFKALSNHALRQSAKYKGVKPQTISLIEATAPRPFKGARHLVFDTGYDFIGRPHNYEVEYQYRMHTLAMAVDRVVLKHLALDEVYLATAVGGDNITPDGQVYVMEPALHVLVDADVTDEVMVRVLTDLYDYMGLCGYVLMG